MYKCRHCGRIEATSSYIEFGLCESCFKRRVIVKTARMEKHLTQGARNKKRLNKCSICGGKTLFTHACDSCAHKLSHVKHQSFSCANCSAYDKCKSHDAWRGKEHCIICGKRDACNAVRGGLCLSCFAKKWDAEHPLYFDAPEMDEYIRWQKEAY